MKLIYLLPLVYISTTFAKPCGLQGTIEERIKECAVTKGEFALVAITEKGTEFYKDMKSNLVWGSRITSDFNHYGSQKACDVEVSEYQVLASLKWRLPTINELEQAAAHGMKTSLPNMEHSYWSSTPVKKKTRRRRTISMGAFIWDGYEQKTDVGDLKDGASVRCVAKE